MMLTLLCRGDSEGEEDEDMDMEVDEVAIARAAARALGQGNTSSANFQDITDGLQELDMDNYDEEDDGTLSPPVCLDSGKI